MAIHKCRECGNQVSTKAVTCPSCGAPVKKPGRLSTGCGCLLVGLVVLLIAGFLAQRAEQERRASLSPEQRKAEDDVKREADAKRKAEAVTGRVEPAT